MLFPTEVIVNQSDFRISMAVKMAKLSMIVYEQFETAYPNFEKLVREEGFEILKTFDNQLTRTQAILLTNHEYLVLCFRGTEADFMDIFTDLRARLKDGGHEGFFGAFESVREDIEKAILEASKLPLYVTGHSLGGALAKVAVQVFGKERIKACYTFGSPAICTKDRLGDAHAPVYLIVNASDIVPRSLSIAGPFVALLLLLLVISKLLLILFRANTSKINEWIQFLKVIGTDSPKYVHFGNIYLLDDLGEMKLIQDQKDSEIYFLKVFTKDFKKTIEDHKVTNYIQKLEQLNIRDST